MLISDNKQNPVKPFGHFKACILTIVALFSSVTANEERRTSDLRRDSWASVPQARRVL